MIFEKLLKKETRLSLIGLGYVGLPIALEFAKKIKVVGFDIKPERVELMRKGIDPSNELTSEAFKDTDILLTSCLLYTSPSPRDRQKTRMPSSA